MMLGVLGIFLLHASAPVSWAELGVSVFFVLSGFLLVRRHADDTYSLRPLENLRLSWCRIRKIYPLHILTMLFAILLTVWQYMEAGWTRNRVFYLTAKTVFNVFLVQSRVPSTTINCSLNGVAWFLSVSAFLYFAFPYVLALIKKMHSTRKLCASIYLVLCIQLLFCACTVRVPPIIDDTFFTWSSYCFPIFRLGDFFIGCVLGYLTLHSSYFQREAFTVWRATVFEIATVLLTMVIYHWFYLGAGNTLEKILKNSTTVFIPLAAAWIVLFHIRKGLLTTVLSAKLFVWLGNRSTELFLIHYVVTRYAMQIAQTLHWTITAPVLAVMIGGELALSIVLVSLYRKIAGVISIKVNKQVIRMFVW